MAKPPQNQYKKMTDSYNEFIAELYQAYGNEVEIWMRAFHRTGVICCFRVGGKEFPVECFAITLDGRVTRGRHEELISMFQGNDGVAIGAKKKYHDKY